MSARRRAAAIAYVTAAIRAAGVTNVHTNYDIDGIVESLRRVAGSWSGIEDVDKAIFWETIATHDRDIPTGLDFLATIDLWGPDGDWLWEDPADHEPRIFHHGAPAHYLGPARADDGEAAYRGRSVIIPTCHCHGGHVSTVSNNLIFVR